MPAPDPETAFEMALARAGIVVPPDRRPVMFEGFLAWRALRDVLDEPMPRITEPAFGLRQPRTPPGCARPAIRACCRRNGQARTPRRRRASKPPAGPSSPSTVSCSSQCARETRGRRCRLNFPRPDG